MKVGIDSMTSNNSNYMNNELIERYLYDVVRRLPEKQREDIKEELKTLIEDMLLEKTAGEIPRDDNIREVLTKLGEPRKLASKYRGEDEHLIGGAYYHQYLSLLKIIVPCVAFGLIVAQIVSSIVHAFSSDTVGNYLGNELGNILSIPFALIQVVGIITIIFAILERRQVNVILSESQWSIEKLPMIPVKKAIIKKSDCIVSIVFSIIAAILFTYAPQLMGVWLPYEGDVISIPVFNLEIWTVIIPFVLISFTLDIIQEVVKLTIGIYNKYVLLTTIITEVLGLGIWLILFRVFNIWNIDFIPQLEKVLDSSLRDEIDTLLVLNSTQMTNIALGLIVIGSFIEIGVTAYRTYQYNIKASL